MSFTPLGPTIGSIAPPLPVADGGTGATTAAAGLAALGGIVQQSATPAAGVALVNGTPGILTWTSPNDGKLHVAMVLGLLNVSVAETGGQVTYSYTSPSGVAHSPQMFASGLGVGDAVFAVSVVIVQANTVVSVNQATALTVGASVLWAEIWGI